MKEQFFHAKLLVYRIGLAMALFTFTRGIFYLSNEHLFPKTSFMEKLVVIMAGWRFDLSAIIYLNALVILGHLLPFSFRNKDWYQKMMKVVFLFCNGVALLLEFSDIEYFKVVLRRTTVNLADQTSDALNLLPQILMDYWYWLVLHVTMMLVANFVYNRTFRNLKSIKLNYAIQIGIFVVGTLLAGIAARGGLQLVPLMPVSAGQYVKDVTLAPLVNNTTLTMIFSLQQRRIAELSYFSKEELDQRFSLERIDPTPGPPNKKNIMIIMMESHGKNMLSRFNNYEGTLPFLDSLIGEGLYTPHTFANGRQSNQGVVSVITGIPSLMEDPLMISQFQNNRIRGLGTLVKEMGYSTHFFHGGKNGTFNIDRFSALVGFDNYFGKNEYNNDKDFDGNWGIYDYPFFRRTVKELSKQEAPFCSVLFSLSSHHPFKVEEWFEKKHPKMNKLKRSFYYADAALEQFFIDASKEPWYDNTIFIVLADHVGYIFEERYKTREGMYQIPIVFFAPDGSLKDSTTQVIQQVDIMPTLLDYINYPKSFNSFGQSVFEENKSPYACMFVNNIYQILDKQHILLFDGKKVVGLYDYQADGLMSNNIKANHPEIVNRLENELKAILQRHHRAMIYNEL